MYVARALEPTIRGVSEQFPVLLLTGARQVGKTTLLKHLSEDVRAHVTLDDPLVLSLAKTDSALFLQRFPPPVLIDEIQYAPELLPHIKMYVDRFGDPGLFWLTGSQQFQLMRGISESLAGRVAILQLLGLSRQELLDEGLLESPYLPTPEQIAHRSREIPPLGLLELYEIIWRGSLPRIALNQEVEPAIFWSSYVQTYLQRDVRDLARVGDELAFLRFLRARGRAHWSTFESHGSGARRRCDPQHRQELALDPSNVRYRLPVGAISHKRHATPHQSS